MRISCRIPTGKGIEIGSFVGSGLTYGNGCCPRYAGVWKSEQNVHGVSLALCGVLLSLSRLMWHHRLLVPVIAGVGCSLKDRRTLAPGVRLPLFCFWMRPLMLWGVLSSLWTGKTLPITEYQEGNLIEVSENLASDIQCVPEIFQLPSIMLALSHTFYQNTSSLI